MQVEVARISVYLLKLNSSASPCSSRAVDSLAHSVNQYPPASLLHSSPQGLFECEVGLETPGAPWTMYPEREFAFAYGRERGINNIPRNTSRTVRKCFPVACSPRWACIMHQLENWDTFRGRALRDLFTTGDAYPRSQEMYSPAFCLAVESIRRVIPYNTLLRYATAAPTVERIWHVRHDRFDGSPRWDTLFQEFWWKLSAHVDEQVSFYSRNLQVSCAGPPFRQILIQHALRARFILNALFTLDVKGRVIRNREGRTFSWRKRGRKCVTLIFRESRAQQRVKEATLHCTRPRLLRDEWAISLLLPFFSLCAKAQGSLSGWKMEREEACPPRLPS